MLKTFVTATAIGGLMLSSALAQSPQPAPGSTMPASPAPSAQAPAAAGPLFIAAQKADQWLASKFSGTDVLGPQNEKIGDVNDVLFDQTGKVVGIVIGVGGFLGIGAKDVAIDMGSLRLVSAEPRPGADSQPPLFDPNNVKLRVSWTKEQLEQAPSFERYKAPDRTTTGTAPGNTGTRLPAR